MILRIQARRVACTSNIIISSLRPTLALQHTPTSRRNAASSTSGGGASMNNPILERWMRRKPSTDDSPFRPRTGDITGSSIFNEPGEGLEEPQPTSVVDTQKPLKERDPSAMTLVIDPVPERRRRWESKMVYRSVKKSGRLTKAQRLKMTERESLTKSPYFHTSSKKLGMLARQVAGKPIEEAITQMRFSKKKVAVELVRLLELARDEAIVRKGMGLGKVEGTAGESVKIFDKKGKARVIEDQTAMYIDQAWVGKGKYAMEPEFRARGRVNFLKRPTTSISVLLKEEKTRIRISDEIAKKRANRKVWVHLPDRPITRQRQYCLW